MKVKFILPLMFGALLTQGCSTANTETIWIGGIKTDGQEEATDHPQLQVYRGEEVAEGNWEVLGENIEDFQFEEGYMKKIEVKKTESSQNDGTKVTYQFVKELDKKRDPRYALMGDWTLAQINGGPINRMVVVPTLNIDVSQMRIAGTGGCNHYFASIAELSLEKIKFTQAGATKMACLNENIEDEYFKVLNQVSSYQLDDQELHLLADDGTIILTYIKVDDAAVYAVLNGNWKAIQIGDLTVEENAPLLSIDTATKKITGNDSCNGFFGSIDEVDDFKLTFSGMGSTQKMCVDMEVADAFLKAINAVGEYQVQNDLLTLFDAQGNELMRLQLQE